MFTARAITSGGVGRRGRRGSRPAVATAAHRARPGSPRPGRPMPATTAGRAAAPGSAAELREPDRSAKRRRALLSPPGSGCTYRPQRGLIPGASDAASWPATLGVSASQADEPAGVTPAIWGLGHLAGMTCRRQQAPSRAEAGQSGWRLARGPCLPAQASSTCACGTLLLVGRDIPLNAGVLPASLGLRLQVTGRGARRPGPARAGCGRDFRRRRRRVGCRG
jgi:hypothetical protein